MTRSNSQGRFTFSGIPAGSYVIQGCAEEFGPSSPVNFELGAGMDLTQDVTMSAGFVRTAAFVQH